MIYSRLPGIEPLPSVVVLGAALYGTHIDEETAFTLMDLFVENGGNFIDTAHIYASWLENGDGRSEQTIGKWLQKTGLRQRICLATKGGHPDLKTGASCMTYGGIKQHIAESLDRLQTDYVDLYWLHRDDPDIPVDEILSWLNEHISTGHIKAIGCSNWTVKRQLEAALFARRNRFTGFCASQVGWSLAESADAEDETTGMLFMDQATYIYHKESGLPVVAYSSQANGFFSGRYNPDSGAETNELKPEVLARYGSDSNFSRLAMARELAKSKTVSTNQIALAYLFGQPFQAFAIVGPRTVEQALDSFWGGDLRLDMQEIEMLRKQFS